MHSRFRRRLLKQAAVLTAAAVLPATGHGKPMRGEELHEALSTLSSQFSLLALPSQGRYLPEAAVANANGVLYVPPRKRNSTETALEIFGVTAVVVFALLWKGHKTKRKRVAHQNLLEVEYNY